jgi:ElaA protein
MDLQWHLKAFSELLPGELYALLRLRSEVFVVEQNCVFLDQDERDQQCYHLMGTSADLLAAYTRIVPPGVIYGEASIGRVVTSPQVRGLGAGRMLMEQSIETVYSLFGKCVIKIGAQLYLKAFYESLGFMQVGEMYLEDGIEHIYMFKYV